MKLKQLKELDVRSIAADDCILFMWTTGPQMANAIELGEAWELEIPDSKIDIITGMNNSNSR